MFPYKTDSGYFLNIAGCPLLSPYVFASSSPCTPNEEAAYYLVLDLSHSRKFYPVKQLCIIFTEVCLFLHLVD